LQRRSTNEKEKTMSKGETIVKTAVTERDKRFATEDDEGNLTAPPRSPASVVVGTSGETHALRGKADLDAAGEAILKARENADKVGFPDTEEGLKAKLQDAQIRTALAEEARKKAEKELAEQKKRNTKVCAELGFHAWEIVEGTLNSGVECQLCGAVGKIREEPTFPSKERLPE
jgi:hypothetical protein